MSVVILLLVFWMVMIVWLCWCMIVVIDGLKMMVLVDVLVL